MSDDDAPENLLTRTVLKDEEPAISGKDGELLHVNCAGWEKVTNKSAADMQRFRLYKEALFTQTFSNAFTAHIP